MPPGSINLTGYTIGQQIREDILLTMTCSSCGGVPAPIMKWYRGGSLLAATAEQDGDGCTTLSVSHRMDISVKYNYFKCSAEAEGIDIESALVENAFTVPLKGELL